MSILDECWEWNGERSHGYGVKWTKGARHKTHRLAYEWANGPIPPGLCVLHRCDNKPCCNPNHLFVGTIQDNHADMIAKRRHYQHRQTKCKHGHEFATNSFIKFTKKGNPYRVCRICKRTHERRCELKRKLRRQSA